MEIIDAHAHIYERLCGFGPRGEARAIGGGMVEWATGQKDPFLKPEHGEYGFCPEKLIELMDEAGVTRAVLLQASNYGFQNSYTAEAVKKYPARFTGAGTFDPYALKAQDIFDNITTNYGFKILKFEISEFYAITGYHPYFKVNGPELAPILEQANSLGMTVVFDTGTMGTKGFQPDEIAEVADKYKDLTIVVAHMLFPSIKGDNDKKLEIIKKLGKRENICFDIAQFQSKEGTAKLEYMRKCMDIVGSQRIAWGSDCPGVFMNYTYSELIDYIVKSGFFTDSELENVMSKTARRIYKIAD